MQLPLLARVALPAVAVAVSSLSSVGRRPGPPACLAATANAVNAAVVDPMSFVLPLLVLVLLSL
jgi:hypothetical protein